MNPLKLFMADSQDVQFRFNIEEKIGEETKTKMISESYTSEAGRTTGVLSVIENAPLDAQYERKTATDGRHYFVLKGKNGESIGRGMFFEDIEDMEADIKDMKRLAPFIALTNY